MGRSPIQTTPSRPLTRDQEHSPHAPSVGVVSTRHRLPDARPAPCRVLPPSPRAYRQTGPSPAAKLARAEPVGVPARRPAHLSETLTERGRTGDRAERGRTAGLGLSLYNKWSGRRPEHA